MVLFRRISALFTRKAQRRDDTYDPYLAASAKDNPYLTEYGTGFVYKTLENAMLATWMMVNDYDEYLADTLENIVLGMHSKMYDPEDATQSCRGYTFELIRLARASLDSDTDAYSMSILTSDEDTSLTEGLSYVARAFLAAVFEGHDNEAMRIVETYTRGQDDDDVVPHFIMFIVTALTLVTREWFSQAFPEFDTYDEGSDDEDVSINE